MTTRTFARQQRMRQQVLNEEKLEQQQKRPAASKLIISSPSPFTSSQSSHSIGVPITSGINGSSTLYATLNGRDSGPFENFSLMQQHGGNQSVGSNEQVNHLSISAPSGPGMHHLLSSSVPVTGGFGGGVSGGGINLITHSPGPGPGIAHSLGAGGSNLMATLVSGVPTRVRSVSHSAANTSSIMHNDFSAFDMDNPLSPSADYSPTDNSNASDNKSPGDTAFANILGDQAGDDVDWNLIEPSLNTASTFSGGDLMAVHIASKFGSGTGLGSVKPSTSCPANMTAPGSSQSRSSHYPISGSDMPGAMSEEQRIAWMRDRNKKDSHNRIERKRRDYINTQITELGALLPDELFRDSDCKKNKGSILKNSVDYILAMRAETSFSEQMRQESALAAEAIIKLYKRVQHLETYIKQETGGSLPSPVAPDIECSQAVEQWLLVHQHTARAMGRSTVATESSGSPSGGHHHSQHHHQAHSGSDMVQRVGSHASISSQGGHVTVQQQQHSPNTAFQGPSSLDRNSQRDTKGPGAMMNDMRQLDPSSQSDYYLCSLSMGVKTEPPTVLDIDMDTGAGGAGESLSHYSHDPVLSAGLYTQPHSADSSEYKFETPME